MKTVAAPSGLSVVPSCPHQGLVNLMPRFFILWPNFYSLARKGAGFVLENGHGLKSWHYMHNWSGHWWHRHPHSLEDFAAESLQGCP